MDAPASRLWNGICLLVVVWLFPLCALATPLAHCGLENVRYEVIELGPAGSTATTLNERGDVAGRTDAGDERSLAFHWDCSSGLQSIDASPDHFFSNPHDINNRGQIVGESYELDGTFAFIWDRSNGMRRISDEQMIAYEINDWGDVALIAGPASVWNEATGIRAFAEVTGVQWWDFPRINNLRTVGGKRAIGEDDVAPQFSLWNRLTGARDLAPITDDNVSVDDMNDRGDLVGTLYREPNGHAYLLTSGGELELLDLPSSYTWTQVHAINNRRQVLGSFGSDVSSATFIWDPLNGSRDFHQVVAGASDASERRYRAVAVNEWGWMAGSATEQNASTSKAVLFVPVPTDSVYFKNLSTLSGARLCRALDAVKLNSILSCLSRQTR